MRLKNNLWTNKGWEIIEDRFNEDQIINGGSLFLIGNGYLGYRGTFLEWRKEHYPACIISNTYDEAEKGWKELCNAPNGLFTEIQVEEETVSIFQQGVENYFRSLDLKSALYRRQMRWQGEKKKRILLADERFASCQNLHLIPLSLLICGEEEMQVTLRTGIDGKVWDLHGTHLLELNGSQQDDLLIMEGKTVDEGIQLVVVEGILHRTPLCRERIIIGEREILREYSLNLKAGETFRLEKVVAIFSQNDTPDPLAAGCTAVKKAQEVGYQRLFQSHQKKWEEIWQVSDMEIKGDLEAQTALRFNLYHNIIAAPAHRDDLPIGARGLSCQAYQGAAFWDQEIFNLPMFIFTRPKVARKFLYYRYKTLPGARKKARDLGCRGAFYPWMSGKTGEELCPSHFFTNLFTNRKIRTHFNDWQIHISPDIIYAMDIYYQATGDWNFIREYGGEMAFEVARFLYSHAFFKKEKNRYEFIRVIGPDEYHENVDNNAFTNYQAHYAVKKAIDIYQELQKRESHALACIMERIGLQEEEVKNWKEMVELLYLPSPDPETHLIEQFQGYFQLEEITPAELKERLLHPQEYWGGPDGIAVETQVMKQADVVQLLALHAFPQEVMAANFYYYQKRTQHGSSLSPSVHAQVAARIHDLEKALEYFYRSVTVDLYNDSTGMVGATFIGGIHTAACGGAWQMMVFGFAGMGFRGDALLFEPALPSPWAAISFSLLYLGNRMKITITKEDLQIKAPAENHTPIKLVVQRTGFSVKPGDKRRVPYRKCHGENERSIHLPG